MRSSMRDFALGWALGQVMLAMMLTLGPGELLGTLRAADQPLLPLAALSLGLGTLFGIALLGTGASFTGGKGDAAREPALLHRSVVALRR